MVQNLQTAKIQLLVGLALGIPLAYTIGFLTSHYSEVMVFLTAGIAAIASVSFMFSTVQQRNKLGTQANRLGMQPGVSASVQAEEFAAQAQSHSNQPKPFFGTRLLAFILVPMIALSRELNLAGLPIRPEDLLLALLVSIWLLRLMANPNLWPPTPLTQPIFVLLGVELASTILGALLGTTSLTLTSPYSGTFFWLKNVEVFLLFFVTIESLPDARNTRHWTYLLALAGVALGVWGMAGHLTGAFPETFIPDPDGGPSYSLMALALLTPSCLVVALALLSKQRWHQLFWLGMLVPLGYSYLYTFSRQAYLGLGAALIFLLYRLQWRAIPFVVLVVVALYNVTPEAVVDRAASVVDPYRGMSTQEEAYLKTLQNGIYTTRLQAWQYRLPEVLLTNPLTGLGSAAIPPGGLDSQYLAMIYYNGLLGLGVFLWLLWSTARMGWAVYQQTTAHPHLRALGLALTMATIGLAVAGLGGMPFIAVRARQMFWLLAAITAAAYRHLCIPAPAPAQPPLPLPTKAFRQQGATR